MFILLQVTIMAKLLEFILTVVYLRVMMNMVTTVSYTHLDVYKRQAL